MTWTLFYIICVVLAGIELAFLQWWEMSHPLNQYGHPKSVEDTQLTLKDLIIGFIVCVVPIVNTGVVLGCTVYIFSKIAPKIVLFGPKKT